MNNVSLHSRVYGKLIYTQGLFYTIQHVANPSDKSGMVALDDKQYHKIGKFSRLERRPVV